MSTVLEFTVKPRFLRDIYETAEQCLLFEGCRKNRDRSVIVTEKSMTLFASEESFNFVDLKFIFNQFKVIANVFRMLF